MAEFFEFLLGENAISVPIPHSDIRNSKSPQIQSSLPFTNSSKIALKVSILSLPMMYFQSTHLPNLDLTQSSTVRGSCCFSITRPTARESVLFTGLFMPCRKINLPLHKPMKSYLLWNRPIDLYLATFKFAKQSGTK